MRRIHTLRIETIVRTNLSSETNQFRLEIMLYLPQVDEEEKPDLSPFLEDEGDNDWVLQQVSEGDVAPTNPHPVPNAQ